MEKEKTVMSPRLLALMRFAKQPGSTDWTWTEIPKVLGDIYHPEMRFTDVMHHLLAAYEEAVMEPRFEITRGRNMVENLLLSPIKGHNSIEFFGPSSMDTKYTVQQFYQSMINTILGDLSVTRIDWCRAELFPEEIETSS